MGVVGAQAVMAMTATASLYLLRQGKPAYGTGLGRSACYELCGVLLSWHGDRRWRRQRPVVMWT